MSGLHRVRLAGEGAVIALDAMRSNKLRSALTILGVLIGVATVMTMASLIQGINDDITSQIENAGPTTFYVVWWWNGGVQVGRPPTEIRQRPFLSKTHADAIERLPEIQYAAMYGITNQRVAYKGDQTRAISVYGGSQHGIEIDGGVMIAGRSFTTDEERVGSPVVVLYEEVADRLFGYEIPLNKVVRIGTRGYRVIGVYRRPDNLFASDGQDQTAVIPFESLRHNFRFPEEQNSIVVKPKDGVPILQAQDAVTRELRRIRNVRLSEGNNFDLVTQTQILDTWNKLTSVFFLVMLVLAGVSLMVGGIGVTAIMMVSVTERTKEIGLRKALGARRADILWQFLVEAATLTLLGGAAGILLGGGLATLLSKLTPIPAVVPLWSVLSAVGASIAVGMVFGVFPANRAARMDPVEALRHE
ncbi:MAG: ABC transporter permease [Gemmatimonadota bacterium]